jgi:hypothetical protein
MSEVTAEQVKAYKNMNIASYVTYVPGLIIWIVVLARIIIFKANFFELILISCLMIVFQIAAIIGYQVQYTAAYLKLFNG